MPSPSHTAAFAFPDSFGGLVVLLPESRRSARANNWCDAGETHVAEPESLGLVLPLRGETGMIAPLKLLSRNQPLAARTSEATTKESERASLSCPAVTQALRKNPSSLQLLVKAVGARGEQYGEANNSQQGHPAGGEPSVGDEPTRRSFGIFCSNILEPSHLAEPETPSFVDYFYGCNGDEGHHTGTLVKQGSQPQATSGTNDKGGCRQLQGCSGTHSPLSGSEVVWKQLTGSPEGLSLTATTKWAGMYPGADCWGDGTLRVNHQLSKGLHCDEESRMWLVVVDGVPARGTSNSNTPGVIRVICCDAPSKKQRRHLGGSPAKEAGSSPRSLSVKYWSGRVGSSQRMFRTKTRGSKLSVKDPSREEALQPSAGPGVHGAERKESRGDQRRACGLHITEGPVVSGPYGLKPEQISFQLGCLDKV
jgi:hypothetical protein